MTSAFADELVCLILANLPARDLGAAELTCKQWHQMAVKTNWRVLFINTMHDLYTTSKQYVLHSQENFATSYCTLCDALLGDATQIVDKKLFTMAKAATKPFLLINKNANKLPFPRNMNAKMLTQIAQKRKLDTRKPATMHYYISPQLRNDYFLHVSASFFMLAGYLPSTATIHLIDLSVNNLIYQFDIGAPEEKIHVGDIQLAFDKQQQVHYMKEKKHHVAVYQLFIFGTKNAVPFFCQYEIVDSQDTPTSEFATSHKLVHEYAIHGAGIKFLHLDLDNSFVMATTEKHLLFYKNTQLVAIMGSAPLVGNVQHFKMDDLTDMICARSIMFAKSKYAIRIMSNRPNLLAFCQVIILNVSKNIVFQLYEEPFHNSYNNARPWNGRRVMYDEAFECYGWPMFSDQNDDLQYHVQFSARDALSHFENVGKISCQFVPGSILAGM